MKIEYINFISYLPIESNNRIMYQVVFQEFSTRGLNVFNGNLISINKNFKNSNFIAGNGHISRYVEKCNEIIPASGICEIGEFDEECREYVRTYSFEYHIPCITSSTHITKLVNMSKKDILNSTNGMDSIQSKKWLKEHIDIEEKIPMDEYYKLPDKQWVQLNSSDDLFIIQVKLRKINPSHKYKNISLNEYWMYKVVKVVFNRREGNLGLVKTPGISVAGIMKTHGKNYIETMNKKCMDQIDKMNKILIRMIDNPVHCSLDYVCV